MRTREWQQWWWLSSTSAAGRLPYKAGANKRVASRRVTQSCTKGHNPVTPDLSSAVQLAWTARPKFRSTTITHGDTTTILTEPVSGSDDVIHTTIILVLSSIAVTMQV